MRLLPFLLSSLFFLVACDDGVLAVCGNGLVDNGEDCDGTAFATIVSPRCEDHGFYPGRAGCSPDCGLDLAPCEAFGSCGDGVVQPEYGELVEYSLTACGEAGFFGGTMTTADCQTHEDSFCGDFRLINDGTSVAAQFVYADANRDLWLSGTVSGTFAGFENPGCPVYEPFSGYDYDSFPFQDGYYLPGCARHYLGHFNGTQALQVTVQDETTLPVVQMLDLGDAGLARLRYECGNLCNYRLELVARDGTVTAGVTRSSLSGNLNLKPQMLRLDEDHLAVLDISNEATGFFAVNTFHLPDLLDTGPSVLDSIPDGEYSLFPGLVHQRFQFPVLWISSSEFYVLLVLNSPQGVHDGLYLLKLGISGLGIDVLSMVPVIADSLVQRVLLARFDLESDEILILHELGDEPSGIWETHLATFTFAGERLADRPFTLPVADEAVLPTSDGGWVIAGIDNYRENIAPTLSPICQSPGVVNYYPHLVAAWYDREGTHRVTRSFYAPGLDLPDFYEHAFEAPRPCPFDRSYTLDGADLIIAGTYDRAQPFCSDGEILTEYLTQPLHSCGSFLVRMEAPPEMTWP